MKTDKKPFWPHYVGVALYLLALVALLFAYTAITADGQSVGSLVGIIIFLGFIFFGIIPSLTYLIIKHVSISRYNRATKRPGFNKLEFNQSKYKNSNIAGVILIVFLSVSTLSYSFFVQHPVNNTLQSLVFSFIPIGWVLFIYFMSTGWKSKTNKNLWWVNVGVLVAFVVLASLLSFVRQ